MKTEIKQAVNYIFRHHMKIASNMKLSSDTDIRYLNKTGNIDKALEQAFKDKKLQ